MLLGTETVSEAGSGRRLLLIKARLDQHVGEASAPALGLMYLGAAARAWSGWQVRALDLWLEGDEEAAVRAALATFRPDVVGLSALTSESRCMHRVARLVREVLPDALILAGGAHPSAYPDECLGNAAIDAVAIGEGEVTLCEVLELYGRGERWQDVPGLVVRADGGETVATQDRPYIEDLDVLPMPAWDLTDIDAYGKRRGQALVGMRRYLPLMTSRGCPYKCTYCHDIQGKRFRSHSPEYVLSVIEYVGERYGVFDFDFIDDIFNFDAARMLRICDGLMALKDKVRFTFPNGIRADRMKPEEVDLLAAAGLEYAGVAIESGTKRVQKKIRKNLRFDKVLPVIEAFHRNDVFVCGFFMLGFHTETEEEIRQTIEYAVRSKLHAAFFFVVTPFQGTELFDQVHDTLGDRGRSENMASGYARAKINLSEVPDDRFFALRRGAYLSFYFDPRRVLSIARAFPRKLGLAHNGAVMLLHMMRVPPQYVFGPIDRLQRLRASVARAAAAARAAFRGEGSTRVPPARTYVLPGTVPVPEHLFTASRRRPPSAVREQARVQLRVVGA